MSSIQFNPKTPEWCISMPKAELHAHLSGSIRIETLKRLVDESNDTRLQQQATPLLDVNSGRTLKQCFQLFPIVHQLITDRTTLYKLVQQVLYDFEHENTLYLELRTTPRRTDKMSAEDYLHTVLQAVHSHHEANPNGIVCRILVSICRHHSLQTARDMVDLVEKFKKITETHLSCLIVGMELSGNPIKGNWDDFQVILDDARNRLGLPISLHFGEVSNEVECFKMLNFGPDRLGHVAVVTEKVVERILQQHPKLGVEVCLTSNLISETVDKIEDHPVITRFIPKKHPFCVCTDDSGIFDTTLSDEYALLADHTSLIKEEVEEIAISGFSLAFCGQQLRDRLILKAKELLTS